MQERNCSKVGLFSKKIGPVFIKETSDATAFIEKMKELHGKNTDAEVRKKIEKQIKLAQYGELGEQNIAFELKNSNMDMYILHDIYLEIDGLSAQIDYIVITRKHVYIVECKNLIGNIEIDNTGAFIRTYEYAGRWTKEGIYSPITQNQRHLQVLKEIRKQSKSNILKKMLFEHYFDETYKSIVVLANPKTYLNAKYAPKQLKEQVIRADGLVAYIKARDEASKEQSMNEDTMLDLAMFFLKQNKPERSDYARKYEEMTAENCTEHLEIDESAATVAEEIAEEKGSRDILTENAEQKVSVDREALIQKLKEFRLQQSREEKVKAYFIFNDAQMHDLVDKFPSNKEELLKVAGFGNVKVEKYGEQVLKILEEYRN